MSSQRRRSLSPLEEKDKSHHKRHRHESYDCRLCRKDHPLRRCIKFKSMNVSEKLKVVKRYRYCENCLGHSHQINRCRNTDRCRQCKGKHHTLLHRHKRLNEKKSDADASTTQSSSVIRSITFLPTVVLRMELGDKYHNVRGILNPCVEVSSIAAFLVERYKLPEEKIGSDRWCKIKIRPRFDDGVSFHVTASVTSDLPRKQPKEKIDDRVASLYSNLRLADPKFYVDLDINFVLGADIYPRLVRPSIQPESVGSPMAQDTTLGWVIIGKFGV